jgi:hypothetical protein
MNSSRFTAAVFCAANEIYNLPGWLIYTEDVHKRGTNLKKGDNYYDYHKRLQWHRIFS